jgi:RNA polymerase sigma-70 factor, ECF subfamily
MLITVSGDGENRSRIRTCGAWVEKNMGTWSGSKSHECLDRQDPDDLKLLDRYFAGDGEAIGDLADRYAGALYSFGVRMCGNRQDAQDLVQDTFLNVIRYLQGFRGETKLKNWLYRLASSVCIKKRRGKNRPDRELPLEATMRGGRDGGKEPEIPDWSQNPVDELLNDELRKHLNSAIQNLPHKYRLVFNLRDLEGFNTQEVADMLNVTPQTVKTRLHRARAFLRSELEDYYEKHKDMSRETA